MPEIYLSSELVQGVLQAASDVFASGGYTERAGTSLAVETVGDLAAVLGTLTAVAGRAARWLAAHHEEVVPSRGERGLGVGQVTKDVERAEAGIDGVEGSVQFGLGLPDYR